MSAVKCPGCGRPANPAERPFCGRGCRDRDLLRWLDEGYRIPGRPALDADGGGGAGDGVDKAADPD